MNIFLIRRLRDQAATCPNCRVEISKSSATRNLAVEKAVSELPNECQYCSKEFPSKSLDRHEMVECEERPTSCKYACIGCPWNGPMHEGEGNKWVDWGGSIINNAISSNCSR